MKNYTNILKHPLLSGSLIIFFGSTLGNFLNFIFNIFISRNLTIQDYGTVATLMAVINLFGISAGAITPTIVSFTSKSFELGDWGSVRGIYFQIFRPIFLTAVITFVLFIVFGSLLSDFLNIANGSALIMLSGLIIAISFMAVINISMLQAKLSFGIISFLNLMSSFLKLAIGVLFVFLGFNSMGVMSAILISYLAPYLLGFTFLGALFNKEIKNTKVDFKELVKYALPSGLSLLGLTALISTDLVLVKHLFDTNSAGIYAGLALIGKVIFFFTAPIGIVMFPLLTRKHKNKETGGKLLSLSIILVGIASLSITVFYFAFPDFVISLFLKNSEYLQASGYLGMYGIFISLYSLCSIMMYYFLSVGKTFIYRLIALSAIIQGVLIYMFHSSFGEIIGISAGVTFLLLMGMFYFYFNNKPVNS